MTNAAVHTGGLISVSSNTIVDGKLLRQTRGTAGFNEFLTLETTTDRTRPDVEILLITLQGNWTTLHIARLEIAISRFWQQISSQSVPARCFIQTSQVDALDMSGTLILYQSIAFLKARQCTVDVETIEGDRLDFVSELMQDNPTLEIQRERKPGPLEQTTELLASMGHSLVDSLAFLGRSTLAMLAVIPSPRRLRFASLVHHIEHTGLRAMPVVALMAFLISIVLAYQGTAQLSRFGAEIFTIDLVAISILREMGVLLTAIMVAGRSGSAFAAEIGVMKLNQEIAAMQTLGINPMSALAVPRILALLITLPMLTLLAVLVGFTGAAVVCILSLDIPFGLFMERLQAATTLTHFMVGMAKAPVFAFLIAIIGVRQGLLVEHSAAEVGHNTTQAVVQAIFAVIAADAVFSIMTTELGI